LLEVGVGCEVSGATYDWCCYVVIPNVGAVGHNNDVDVLR